MNRIIWQCSPSFRILHQTRIHDITAADWLWLWEGKNNSCFLFASFKWYQRIKISLFDAFMNVTLSALPYFPFLAPKRFRAWYNVMYWLILSSCPYYLSGKRKEKRGGVNLNGCDFDAMARCFDDIVHSDIGRLGNFIWKLCIPSEYVRSEISLKVNLKVLLLKWGRLQMKVIP